MLAGEVTNLAVLWLAWVARSGFAGIVWIEVPVGGGAVAVGRDWVHVDVIDCTCKRLFVQDHADLHLRNGPP